MNEIIEKMKRIDDIVNNRISYDDILPIIEWFTDEPEWEEILFLEVGLRKLYSEMNEKSSELSESG